MSMRDSVCVIGGVLLGGAICYKILTSVVPKPIPIPPIPHPVPVPPNPYPVPVPPNPKPIHSNFYTDIFILHADIDQTEADDCKAFLIHNFPNIPHLQVALPEDLLAPGTIRLPGLSSILDSCRLVFLFVTTNLETDPVTGYGTQINLIQSINDPLKEARLIPLQVNEAKISFHLSPIIPLKYVNNTSDRQFPNFKLKFEKLVNSWRNVLP